jgi:tRNA (cmo5U34)-methyltransferase
MNMYNRDNLTPHKAEQYDVDVRKTVPFFDLFYEQTIDLVKSTKPDVKVWLDTGCGAGSLVSEAFAHFPITHFILADPSQSMLDEAQKRLVSLPQGQFRILPPAGTESLVLEDNTGPDVITAIQCHHYLDAATRHIATQKCHDMLTEGGTYITFENIHSFTANGVNIGLARWQDYQRSQGRDEKSVQYHRTRFNREYFPISVTAHIELLKECGFGVVELLWYSYMQAGFYAIK